MDDSGLETRPKKQTKIQREPKPSTSYGPVPVSSEEEEVEGFVEVPCEQMTTLPYRSVEKAVCCQMSVCPFCGKRFFSYRVLIVHVNLNHVTESQTKSNLYVLNSLLKECKMCGYMTPHYSHMKKHMISKHQNYEPFQCSFCNFTTSMQVTLRKHVRFNHTNQKVYQCSKCDFKALTNFSKQIHINNAHMKTRYLHCSECEFKSRYVRTLRKHIKLNHTGVEAHLCSFCSYKTDSDNKLKRHLKAKHTEEKPYQCALCTFKATDFINFKKHLAFKHYQVLQIISTLSPYI